jgi:hypothetical protein
MPRRGFCPTVTVSHITDQHRIAVALRQHRVAASPRPSEISPNARTTAACVPILTVLPPTLMLLLFSACSELRKRQPIGNELVEIDLELECLGLAAPSDDVDDSGTARKRRCSTQSCRVLRSSTL